MRTLVRTAALLGLIVGAVLCLVVDRDPVMWTAGVLLGGSFVTVLYEMNK